MSNVIKLDQCNVCEAPCKGKFCKECHTIIGEDAIYSTWEQDMDTIARTIKEIEQEIKDSKW